MGISRYKRDAMRERKKARVLVTRIGLGQFMHAQNNRCSLCNKVFKVDDPDIISIDHVHPLTTQVIYGSPIESGDITYFNAGNLLLAHQSCNRKKSGNLPEQSEIDLLERVNDILGYDPQLQTYRVANNYKHILYARNCHLKRVDAFFASFDDCDFNYHRPLTRQEEITFWMYQVTQWIYMLT